MNAIELNHVAKRYGDFALEDVNLTLPQGCVLGLIGENGAGKSTLIRMMLGACRPDGGEVRVLGEKAGRTAAFTKVRQDIGVVLDEACLPDELTAQQVGKMMHGIYANWDDAAFSSLCARLDLPKGKKVKDFSRGTKMKLAIAVALSHKAKLLVLDEATGGLDPVVRDEILDLLNDFTREEEHAILLSSHIVTDLEKICDYVVFLHKGRVPDGGGKGRTAGALCAAEYDARRLCGDGKTRRGAHAGGSRRRSRADGAAGRAARRADGTAGAGGHDAAAGKGGEGVMKGILFKDFLSAKRILTIYLLMIICFSFGGAKGVFFALCYSIMVPVNLLGFDERSRFDRYASVLPLTGMQCVADKYIVTYLCMAMMMALSSLIAFIRTGAASAMEDMLLYAATVLATHALCMPAADPHGRDERAVGLSAVAGR